MEFWLRDDSRERVLLQGIGSVLGKHRNRTSEILRESRNGLTRRGMRQMLADLATRC
jgi:hypothetical protein